MLWPNIWMLFLPIPQSSFLQQLTGLGYSQMIRYHRQASAGWWVPFAAAICEELGGACAPPVACCLLLDADRPLVFKLSCRWVGHITLVVLSLHAWCYYIYWALKKE